MCSRLIFSTFIAFTFFKGYSQERLLDTTKVTDLAEVVLTATRTERQLSSLPLPITLIPKAKIIQSGTIRLNEMLTEQTGIINVADESGFEGIQIQGIASDYVLILIDGVPLVGRKAGNFDLSRLTLGNVKQIEVVKGPSSSLYGSEALGGVINIITEKPKREALNGNISYRTGTFARQDVNFDINQRLDQFSYTFFINRLSSDGYDISPEEDGQTVSPFENYTLNSRFFYDFNEKLSMFSSVRYYDQKQEAGITFEDEFFEGDAKEKEWNAHLRLDHKWNDKLDVDYEVYYTNYKASERLVGRISDEVLTDSDFNRSLIRPEVRGNYIFEKAGTLTAGLGYQYDELDRTFFDEKVSFNSQYIYAQYDLNFEDKLNLIVGARFDNHSEYSNQLSPKIALRYEIANGIALKGSVGYGFKAPDFRQLYFDFTNSAVGYTVLGYNVAFDKLRELQAQGQILDVVVQENERQDALEAESSVGYNFGLTYIKGAWNTELNFFRNNIKNLIDTRIIARKTNGQNVFSYRNFDKIYTTGLELNVGYKFNKNINLSAGYQLLYAFDQKKEELVEDGKVFARDPQTNQTVVVDKPDYFGLVNRSRHNANFKLFYDIPSVKSNVNLRLFYKSKYALFDTNGNGLIDIYDTSFIDGYLTANIAATKEIINNFNIQVGANNLFDYTDAGIPTLPGIQGFLRLSYDF